MNIAKFLQSVFLFNKLDQPTLEKIASVSSIKVQRPGNQLFREDQLATCFYVVIDGKFKIYKANMDGQEQTLHIQGPGDLMAEAALFDNQKFPASCEALEPGKVICINGESFLALIRENHELTLKLFASYSKRLRQLTTMIEELSLHDVRFRFIQYLCENARVQGDKWVVDLELSKKEMASLIGTIPETISRAFRHFQDQGLIRVHQKEKSVELLDFARLKRIINS